MVVTAIRPLEQNRFTTWTGVVSGIPAASADARATNIAPGVSTLPTQTSWINDGSRPEFEMAALNIAVSSSSALVIEY